MASRHWLRLLRDCAAAGAPARAPPTWLHLLPTTAPLLHPAPPAESASLANSGSPLSSAPQRHRDASAAAGASAPSDELEQLDCSPPSRASSSTGQRGVSSTVPARVQLPTSWHSGAWPAAPAVPRNPRSAQVRQAHSSAAASSDEAELAKFAALADRWWDPAGPFAPLHAMNPTRVSFVVDALCDCFGLPRQGAQPLAGLRLLDVGCGGGLLAEALARQGAQVLGVEPAPANIAAARLHAARDPLIAQRVAYRAASAEQLAAEGAHFDAVLALEVVEHVADPPAFCATLARLARPGGAVVMSTINRTPRAYAIAVVGAEYVVRAVPAGTHDWARFVTPDELVIMLQQAGLRVEQAAGMVLNPLTRRWSLTDDLAVNYIAYFSKPDAEKRAS